MPWLWLILAGVITVALVSYVLVIGLGNLMIHRDWNKLIREEMASVEKEYRDLCGHLLPGLPPFHRRYAAGGRGAVRGQPRACTCRECRRLTGAGIPEHGDDSRGDGGRARRREDRLPRRQAGGAHPRHHAARIAGERPPVAGVPAFLQLGQEHGAADMPQCIGIPPPQADLLPEDRVHVPALS